jgi:UDP-N-acetylglucosamine 4,6-dehydratase
MGSRGSVIPYFKRMAAEGKPIPITDSRMTRFFITLQDAVRFVIHKLTIMQGGEIYIPILQAMRIVDLAKAIAPDNIPTYSGIRPNEKLHEVLISSHERNVVAHNGYYIIYPEYDLETNDETTLPRPVSDPILYRSDLVAQMSPSEIRKLIESIPKEE